MMRSPRPDPAPGARSQTDRLAELHTRLLDTIAGLDAVLEKAEPEFVSIARDFRTLHDRHAQAVAAMLTEDGHDPAADGSFFGHVNRAVVAVRSWFDDISTNIMDALVEGEKHVLDAYDSVLEMTPEGTRRQTLTEQRTELVALLDRHATE